MKKETNIFSYFYLSGFCIGLDYVTSGYERSCMNNKTKGDDSNCMMCLLLQVLDFVLICC